MSFIMRKKKYKFQVEFEVEELANVPFVNGMLFTKVQLLDGGSFTECTDSAEVMGHSVYWKTCFRFDCKIVSNATSGVLEPCLCRVSVRKETKGGKSYQKLGFATVDLAQFAGAGKTVYRCLLNGYDTKRRREDNSTLKISIHLVLRKGDPCFKVSNPVSGQMADDDALNKDNRVSNGSEDEVNPTGFNGLVAFEWNVQSEDQAEGTPIEDMLQRLEKDTLPAPGHSRNASTVSNQSKTSGLFGSLTSSHSRNPSTDSSKVRINTCGSAEVGLSGSVRSRFQKVDENTLNVVDGVLKTAGFSTLDDGTDEASGLHLAVAKDGKTVLQTVRSVTSSQSSASNTIR